MDKIDEPSENCVASDSSQCEATPRNDTPGEGAGGHELNQYAATLAGAVVKEAVETFTRLMRGQGAARNQRYQFEAARELLRLAGEREGTTLVAAPRNTNGGVSDDLAERREKLRQLRQAQRRDAGR